MHSNGLHHYHLRKRGHDKNDPYPHPDRFKRFVDKAILFVGVLGPVLTIPQVLEIWVGKNAAGVSLFSWSAYVFTSSFWVLYGVLHRTAPIIVTYSLWVLLEVTIVTGILLYG